METERDQQSNVDVHSAGDGPTRGIAAIGAAAAILFIGIGYTNTFGVFADYYEQHLFPEEPTDKILVIGSVAASLYFILGAFTGQFSDFVGYQYATMTGAAMMIGAMFAASVSTEYYQLLLSQGVLFGIGVAFVYPPATSISRQYFSKRHGMANGIVVSGGALGGCILPYCVQRMIESYGLSKTFRILGYLAIAVLIPSIALLRPQNRIAPARRHVWDFSLLSNPTFLALMITCMISMTGFLPRYFLVPSSARVKGVSQTYASWLLGIMNGLSVLGRIGIGYVADRFGKLNALCLSFILCGIGHFAFWVPAVTVPDRSSATAFFTLFVTFIGIFGSGFIALIPVVVSDLFGTSALASKSGLLNSAIGLSVLAGPSIVSAIVEAGTYWIGVLTAGGFLFSGGSALMAYSVLMRKATSSHAAQE